MRLTTEYLPALGCARQELVLLHGWSSSSEIWRRLLRPLRGWANITLIDLPGCSPVNSEGFDGNIATLLAAILDQAPQRAVYVGWSLGGQVATLLAQHAPQRVAALITLSSNPRFVASGDWPGLASETFAEFKALYERGPAEALQRFDLLQCLGSKLRDRRSLLGELQNVRGEMAPQSQLVFGLDWLAELDLVDVLADLQVPQLHLLGSEDSLVPVALAQRLNDIPGRIPVQAETLPGATHAALLECPEKIAERVQVFLAAHALLGPTGDQSSKLDKAEVAASFSRAASAYDSVAALQRDVGLSLLERCPAQNTVAGRLLDLGSGTGYFCQSLRRRFPAAVYFGLDIAQGMVEHARAASEPSCFWLVGDAEQIPLASGSVDFIFSSLALQWSDRPDLLLAEMTRVLKPGGRCLFTSLGPGTLGELRDAWAAVDQHQHVNTFLEPDRLLEAASALPGLNLTIDSKPFVMFYDTVADLLRELKTLGAHNMNEGRPAGLTSRRKLLAMFEAYEQFRTQGRLPASYDVLIGTLEKQ
ncbi:MAG: malonyl-ACP O-methyltransferase BioC [Halieaceae bacterium]